MDRRAVADKSPPAAQERIIEVLDRLPAAERRRFADIFTGIIEDLSEARGVARMMFEDVDRPGRRIKKK
jgi:hypothetical protein